MYERAGSDSESAKDLSLDSEKQSEDHASETRGFLETSRGGRRPRARRWASPLLLYPVGVVLWAASLVLVASVSTRIAQRDSFARGFRTDLEPLRSAIEIRRYRFTSNLGFDANGTLFITDSPTGVRYVGEPSDEIDAAWRALLQVDGVDLIGAEATSVVGKTLKKESGHYLVGIDGFHHIHCLNMIRKALRPDYYPMNDPEPVFKTHINHCLDYVRQALMCNIDVTPLLLTWNHRMNRPMPDFEAMHTCRNFEKVQRWMAQRNGLDHPLPFAPGRPRPAPG